MRTYTNIEQSKRLAEFLLLESADGFWEYHDYVWYSEGDEWEGYENYPIAEPYLEYTRKENEWKEDKSDIPCWSLIALLEIIPVTIKRVDKICRLRMDKSEKDFNIWYEEVDSGLAQLDLDVINPNIVDACVEMIEKLHNEGL